MSRPPFPSSPILVLQKTSRLPTCNIRCRMLHLAASVRQASALRSRWSEEKRPSHPTSMRLAYWPTAASTASRLRRGNASSSVRRRPSPIAAINQLPTSSRQSRGATCRGGCGWVCWRSFWRDCRLSVLSCCALGRKPKSVVRRRQFSRASRSSASKRSMCRMRILYLDAGATA